MNTREPSLQLVRVGGVLNLIAFGIAMMMLLGGPCLVIGRAESRASRSARPEGRDVEKGRVLFMKYGCYQCHGTEAQGGGYTGPRLAPPAPPLAVLLSQVRHPSKDMPPYTTKVVSDQELSDIDVFLQSIPAPPVINTIPTVGAAKQ